MEIPRNENYENQKYEKKEITKNDTRYEIKNELKTKWKYHQNELNALNGALIIWKTRADFAIFYTSSVNISIYIFRTESISELMIATVLDFYVFIIVFDYPVNFPRT